jgi:hypothetical protein
MAEYIKREDALKLIVIHNGDSCNDCEYKNTDKACSDCLYSVVNKIPAADVRENVRGKWIPYNPIYSDVLCCSECEYMPAEAEFFNYCPNCGADMRGE